MEPKAPPPAALERPRSGRERLSAEAVRESQRVRLLAAVAAAVAEKGYGATTVADIVERASVSRTTFYEQFRDKEACFLAAFDFGVEVVLTQMLAAWREADEHEDWRAHVRSDLTAYLRTLSAEPGFAKALHLEVFGAGAAALERRAQMIALFTERTRRIHELARSQDASVRPLSAEIFKLHSAGLDEIIREHLRTQGTETVVELTEPLVAVTLALFGDLGADAGA